MLGLLFGDQHFVNMLGDLLNKKPGARKVDAFISK